MDNMRGKRRRKKWYAYLATLLLVITITPMIISYCYLPTEIKLIAGKEHIFDFDIPICAAIKTNDGVTIKDSNNAEIVPSKIHLNHPLSICMTHPGKVNMKVSLLGIVPLKTVSVEAYPYQEVIPSGRVVGIKVDMQGVLVMGVGGIDVQGQMRFPCKGLLAEGDILLTANGKALTCKEDLKNIVENAKNQSIELEVIHNKERRKISVRPIYSESDDAYKLGVWIKDSTQGIGTMTYINPETGYFGALGHGITDTESKKLMPIKSGDIQNASITGIKKGEKGIPGEICGKVHYQAGNHLGDVINNTPIGIYGIINKEALSQLGGKTVPIAFQDEVTEGKATILVDLLNGPIEEYEVVIQKVSKYNSEPSKGMLIKIVDKELLSLTNGIVQGMSGSPILQNGKLIGAVTHVFVQDPTKGYGIFIENMINNEKR